MIDGTNELIDLSGTAVAGSDVGLAGRQDTAVLGVTSTSSDKRRVLGIAVSPGSGNAGYLVARLDQRVILTADLVVLGVLTQPLPLDVDIPTSATLKFSVHTTTGTAVCSVLAFVKRGA
jgi:hypothetical protein